VSSPWERGVTNNQVPYYIKLVLGLCWVSSLYQRCVFI